MSDNDKPTRPLPKPRGFSQAFWDAAKQKKFMIQFCKDTDKPQHYPRPISIYTGSRNVEWREVSGKGKIFAHTITRVKPGNFRHMPDNYAIVTVELDEGTRFMAPWVGDNDYLKPGNRVKIGWERLNDDFNYPYFEADE